jgi:transcriptional regulator with XRE-family HTH domain
MDSVRRDPTALPPPTTISPNATDRDLAYLAAGLVADARNHRGISQGDLATAAGMKQPHSSRLESARTQPTLAVLHRLADAMGLRLVIGYTDPEQEEQ